jgi:hypothetical protein
MVPSSTPVTTGPPSSSRARQTERYSSSSCACSICSNGRGRRLRWTSTAGERLPSVDHAPDPRVTHESGTICHASLRAAHFFFSPERHT